MQLFSDHILQIPEILFINKKAHLNYIELRRIRIFHSTNTRFSLCDEWHFHNITVTSYFATCRYLVNDHVQWKIRYFYTIHAHIVMSKIVCVVCRSLTRGLRSRVDSAAGAPVTVPQHSCTALSPPESSITSGLLLPSSTLNSVKNCFVTMITHILRLWYHAGTEIESDWLFKYDGIACNCIWFRWEILLIFLRQNVEISLIFTRIILTK